jgi:CheY-like chemotaxis protein
MPAFGLGAKSLSIYTQLMERIVSGELLPGAQLPSYPRLAAQFGVAPMTIRQVLGRLEAEGLIARRNGLGTFVCAPSRPSVLVVDDEPEVRRILVEYIHRAGYTAIEAATPEAGIAALDSDPSVALVLSDIRMPESADGIGFIRQVRRRWPELPIAAVTAYPADLEGLHGTPESPILVVPKPFRAHQIGELLRLGVRVPAPTVLPVAAGAGWPV